MIHNFLERPSISFFKKNDERNIPYLKNNSDKTNLNMGIENIEKIENLVKNTNKDVKKVKSDKGLIERVESSKIVLTEDNKQLLND